ncbi:MAG: HupE/UreJ family protein [Desulfobacterales bacterium]
MKKILLTNLRFLIGVVISASLLKPTDAAAHLVTTGMGPVYDGIGHLLLTPEDLVPAVAMALYAGLRGRAPGRRALFFFPLAWLIGGFIGLAADTMPVFPVSAFSFLLVGILIAADLRLPDNAFTVLAVAVGIMHGFFNGIALKAGPAGLGLLGIMSALFVLVALVSAFVVSLKPPWARIVVRVAGSWVAAMGLLMIGWFFRGQA